MTEFSNNEVAEIACIFVNLGAPKKQAEVMASQLIKRAEQIAQERDISKVEATERLLKQVLEARQGS
jgi:N-acetylglutamate synthase-like GNAT family acetyltransferase